MSHIEEEILGTSAEASLWEKARAGTLTAADLPQGFATVKMMLVGVEKPRVNAKRVDGELKQLEEKLAVARRNIATVDVEFIPDVQSEIRRMQRDRDALHLELQNTPTLLDINQAVLGVLRKLYWLATMRPELIKPALREIDSITVHTESTGTGPRTRHNLKKAEIHLAGTGAVTSDLNRHLLG